jgi:hypothetical protein
MEHAKDRSQLFTNITDLSPGDQKCLLKLFRINQKEDRIKVEYERVGEWGLLSKIR